jgi:hypothetical protein
MKHIQTTKQLINAELSTRSSNTKAKNVLKRHTPKREQAGLLIEFNCECSDVSCNERIPMTLNEYEEQHESNSRFVLARGHQEPRVEKIEQKKKAYTVVEKYAL